MNLGLCEPPLDCGSLAISGGAGGNWASVVLHPVELPPPQVDLLLLASRSQSTRSGCTELSRSIPTGSSAKSFSSKPFPHEEDDEKRPRRTFVRRGSFSESDEVPERVFKKMVELKYQQTNRSTNTILLNFLLEHPHEFTKNVPLFTRAGSRFEILKSEQEFPKQLFVKL